MADCLHLQKSELRDPHHSLGKPGSLKKKGVAEAKLIRYCKVRLKRNVTGPPA